MKIVRSPTRQEDLEDDLTFTECPYRRAIIMEELDRLGLGIDFAYLNRRRKIR